MLRRLAQVHNENISTAMLLLFHLAQVLEADYIELSPVDRVEISTLPVTQNSIKIKRAITWQSFQPRAEFNPGVEISTLLQLAGLKFQPWVENFVM